MTRILRGPLLRFRADPFTSGAEAALGWHEDGAVAVAGERIITVGDAPDVISAHPGAEVASTGGRLIAPGFVDCHLHYPQTRIVASWGAQLLDWLNTYTFPEEARFADAEYAAEVAREFFDLTLANGITTTCSYCTTHPTSSDAYFTEAQARRLRVAGGRTMMDRNAPPDLCDTAQRAYDESKALIARWHGRARATYAITPRFVPTSTPAQLEAAGALWAEHPDCPMQTHLSENPSEIGLVKQLFPDEPDYFGVYQRFGLTGPGSIFGHAIHLTPRERAALAETGAAVAHCPTSNQFLGSGECDVAGLKASGVPIGLATDVGGGSSFSMFDTMKAAYETGQRRGVALSPVHLWWLATEGSARVLRIEQEVGNLEAGREADLVLIDLAATPILAARTARAQTAAEIMFALIVLADERAVSEVWSGGRMVHARGAVR
ncbi:guanine deaminase [Limibaculum sp. M0105]|uniref:Guanine deaminase n=1 Tax=Thermohalobaculum xanthum TaxID=2753746 RepID=A0A8J7M652_9RHOB|nr:guanine deaminase [Thermohalobaculum xanthum]MBK0398963.1 guanine deaminase [Thermohalobaculum xanthum]